MVKWRRELDGTLEGVVVHSKTFMGLWRGLVVHDRTLMGRRRGRSGGWRRGG